MNKKAFTLIELLGVITILAILFLVITPTVSNIISNSKEKALDRNVNTILTGAKDWVTENSKYLPNKGNKINITLSQLKQLGYVDTNIKNPKSGKLFSNNMIITIENTGDSIPNSDEKYTKYSGDYKFSLQIQDFDNNYEYDENNPIISLKGDIVYFLELNSEYIDPGYTAYTKLGNNITSNVSTVIRKGEDTVLSIDNTKLGVYYIDYTVNDSEYSTTVTRTIIVTDTTPPKILFSDSFNNTYTPQTSSIDLKEGVSCSDNSGKCSITTSGSITLGVTGKYVIKYISSDDSGNTSTVKKVITIKKLNYEILDYIKTTGTQYIDTSYNANPDTKLEMDIQFISNSYTNTSTSNVTFVGSSIYESNRFQANFGQTADKSKMIYYWTNKGYDGSHTWVNEYSDVTKRSTFTLTGKSATFQGITISTETKENTNEGNILLFAYYNSSTNLINAFNRYDCKIYGIKIYNGNDLVRNFVPARIISNNELGLFDTVNNKFYSNMGTGKFIIDE